MSTIVTRPIIFFLICLGVFSLAAWGGAWFHRRSGTHETESHGDFAFVVGGILTLLALILGFTFSMALTRYDQRKSNEEQEANSIATEYRRVSLFSSPEADSVRKLLRSYLGERVLFYTSESDADLNQTDLRTNDLEARLWAAAASVANSSETSNSIPVMNGMNHVFSSRSRTRSAWRNRIPHSAMLLVIVIAILSNFLVGYTAHRRGVLLLMALPLAVAISLFMIADIDSPRGGYIRIRPQDLQSVTDVLRNGS
jgi:hypothetical protein